MTIKRGPMPLWMGDFLGGTLGWSGDERCVYVWVLATLWETERLPVDQELLRQILGISPGLFNRSWRRIRGKLATDERGYFSARLEEHRLEAEQRRESKQRGAALTHQKLGRKFDAQHVQPGEANHAALPMPLILSSPNTSEREENARVGEEPEKAEKGRRLDPSWSMSPEDRAFAVAKGLDPDRTAEKFKNYWLSASGKHAIKRDWVRTWQNWCITDAERLGLIGPPAKPTPRVWPPQMPTTGGRPTDAILDRALRAKTGEDEL